MAFLSLSLCLPVYARLALTVDQLALGGKMLFARDLSGGACGNGAQRRSHQSSPARPAADDVHRKPRATQGMRLLILGQWVVAVTRCQHE